VTDILSVVHIVETKLIIFYFEASQVNILIQSHQRTT